MKKGEKEEKCNLTKNLCNQTEIKKEDICHFQNLTQQQLL